MFDEREYVFRPGPCAFACGNNHTGIAIRADERVLNGRQRGSGHVRTVLICDACWNQDHPDRVPVRIK